MKRIIKRALPLLLALCILSVSAMAANISDISDDYWASGYANYMVDNGIMPTDEYDCFYPNVETTRGEFVLYLWRAAGCPDADIPSSVARTGHASFEDVWDTDEYFYAVEWAVQNNITAGTGKGAFSPELALTREQAFTFLYRALSYFGIEFSRPQSGDLTIGDFMDAEDIDTWAGTPIQAMLSLGIVNGTDNGYLLPLRDVNNAATAKILYQAMLYGGLLNGDASYLVDPVG